GRKRKAREELTGAEKRQRRIEKRFGRNGVELGGEEEMRVKLESGKRRKGKPRVAGSARGRELRAAAALARFGVQKEEEMKREIEEAGSGSATETDSEDVEPKKEALDLDGSRLVDGNGNGMVKVCEDEDLDSVHVKEEMQEFQGLARIDAYSEQQPQDVGEVTPQSLDGKAVDGGRAPSVDHPTVKNEAGPSSRHPRLHNEEPPRQTTPPTRRSQDPTKACSICSMENGPSALLCAACSHVLDPSLIPGHWKCSSLACQSSQYVNAGDSGMCGVCGTRKPAG
ncbi:MAG: hypothetical protein Q9190_007122, partial [Brigantiaea leucoxantha]